MLSLIRNLYNYFLYVGRLKKLRPSLLALGFKVDYIGRIYRVVYMPSPYFNLAGDEYSRIAVRLQTAQLYSSSVLDVYPELFIYTTLEYRMVTPRFLLIILRPNMLDLPRLIRHISYILIPFVIIFVIFIFVKVGVWIAAR